MVVMTVIKLIRVTIIRKDFHFNFHLSLFT